MLGIIRRAFSFADWNVHHPKEPPPGDMLDASFDAQNQKISEIEALVSDLRRSDGQLRNDLVGADQLSPDLREYLRIPAARSSNGDELGWKTAEATADVWAHASADWAEHMPDTIPNNSVAVMDITGDHWSSRWWAHQASINATTGANSVLIADEPPSEPSPVPHGRLWWDSDSGRLFIRYDDGDSAQWVQVSGGSGGSSDFIVLTPPMFGAKADDPSAATSNVVALNAWLAAAGSSGSKAVGTAGTFWISGQVEVDVGAFGKDLTITAPRDFVIKSTAAVADPLVQITDLGGICRYGLEWRGGTFDNSLGIWVDNAQSNTGLELTRLNRVLIDGVRFLGGNDMLTGTFTSDAGITCVDTFDLTITNCFFRGVQSGLYFTGTGGVNSKGSHIVTNNHFSNCQRAMQTKAEVDCTIFADNTIEDCAGFAFTTIEVSDDYPARKAIVIGNTAKRVEGLAMLRGPGPGSIVANNIVVDFGRNLQTLAQSGTPQAIRLLGITDCIVTGNSIQMQDYTPIANDVAIFLTAFTLGGVAVPGPRAAERNHVYGNTIVNVDIAMYEGATAPVGTNYYGINVLRNVTTAYGGNILNNLSPFIHQLDNGWGYGRLSATSLSVRGVGIGVDGLLTAVRDNSTVAQFNRLTGHGPIVSFYQAGVLQGSVQTDATLAGFFNGMLRFPDKTLASLGAASTWARMMAYTSNGWGGQPGIVFSNGTNWIRLDTGATAS